MNIAIHKPRWKDWENQCIMVAFKKKIQYKVIALALEKTVTSLNKKITKLGLREPKNRPGRIKGECNSFKGKERISRDLREMREILETFAPVEISQKSKMVLKNNGWCDFGASSLKKLEKGLQYYKVFERHADYRISPALHYILNNKEREGQTRVEKIAGYPFYVPYQHVEQWALLAGFRPVENNLKNVGLQFWKDGKYFTRAQLLMTVNGIRKEKNLQPILYEDFEEEEYENLKRTQDCPSYFLTQRSCKSI